MNLEAKAAALYPQSAFLQAAWIRAIATLRTQTTKGWAGCWIGRKANSMHKSHYTPPQPSRWSMFICIAAAVLCGWLASRGI